jgi:biotin--protein ligase
MGTAVVHAVRTMDGYQDLDVRVKWPNDIYYMKNVKLGGTLVNCLSMGQEKVAIFGVGVNVTNDYPTLSLNDCINLHNIAHSANLKPISIEQLLARTLNVLEALIDDMEGVLLYGEMEDTLFMNLYYKYWLHSDPQNIVFLEKTGEYVTITGIDQYGYLVVWDRSNQRMTLQPDGNSFDLMKGLIKVKH